MQSRLEIVGSSSIELDKQIRFFARALSLIFLRKVFLRHSEEPEYRKRCTQQDSNPVHLEYELGDSTAAQNNPI